MDTKDLTPSPELVRRFTYHPPKSDMVPTFTVLREGALELGTLIEHHCPDGREKAQAIAKLEEVIMWANAAVARPEAVAPRRLTMETPAGQAASS